jgi:hypothetical protein
MSSRIEILVEKVFAQAIRNIDHTFSRRYRQPVLDRLQRGLEKNPVAFLRRVEPELSSGLVFNLVETSETMGRYHEEELNQAAREAVAEHVNTNIGYRKGPEQEIARKIAPYKIVLQDTLALAIHLKSGIRNFIEEPTLRAEHPSLDQEYLKKVISFVLNDPKAVASSGLVMKGEEEDLRHLNMQWITAFGAIAGTVEKLDLNMHHPTFCKYATGLESYISSKLGYHPGPSMTEEMLELFKDRLTAHSARVLHQHRRRKERKNLVDVIVRDGEVEVGSEFYGISEELVKPRREDWIDVTVTQAHQNRQITDPHSVKKFYHELARIGLVNGQASEALADMANFLLYGQHLPLDGEIIGLNVDSKTSQLEAWRLKFGEKGNQIMNLTEKYQGNLDIVCQALSNEEYVAEEKEETYYFTSLGINEEKSGTLLQYSIQINDPRYKIDEIMAKEIVDTVIGAAQPVYLHAQKDGEEGIAAAIGSLFRSFRPDYRRHGNTVANSILDTAWKNVGNRFQEIASRGIGKSMTEKQALIVQLAPYISESAMILHAEYSEARAAPSPHVLKNGS